MDEKHLTRFWNENSVLKLSVVVSTWMAYRDDLRSFSSNNAFTLLRLKIEIKSKRNSRSTSTTECSLIDTPFSAAVKTQEFLIT